MSAPTNARKTTHGGRFYVWGKGERYWSVTTILKALPKDALKFWAAKTVAEFAVDRAKTWMTMERDEAVEWLKREPLRFTGKRAGFGTAVHAAAEAYALKAPMRGAFEDEERRAMGQFLRYCDLVKPRFVSTEASVYHRTQKYAGTLDSIQELDYGLLRSIWGPALIPWEPAKDRDFVRLMVDYKTGGDVDEGKGVYPEVALQLAAYGHAEFIGAPNGTELPLPEIDGYACLQVQANGWRLVPVDAANPAVFQSFLYAREVFRWIEVISKDVLGAELVPARTDIGSVPDDPFERVTDDRRGDPVHRPAAVRAAPAAPAAVDDTAPPPPRRRPTA